MRGTFEDEPAPEIGPGWVRRTKHRPKGQSGKRFDRYFLSPERHGQRRQFRSLVAAQAYHAGKLDELDAVCEACGSGVDEPGNDILLCDGCNAAHHMACLPVPLKAVPEGEWLCPACKGGPVGARPPKVRPGTIIVQKAAASPRAVTAARHSPGRLDPEFDPAVLRPELVLPARLRPACVVLGCPGEGIAQLQEPSSRAEKEQRGEE
uniref:PHD-type domain-containing protein n=1 Tax=Emiliania huxleyi TaxID=2903 RepID=A0A6V2XL98_EMIHU